METDPQCETQEEVTWLIHPLRMNPLRSFCLIVILALLLVAIKKVYVSPVWVLLSALLLGSSLSGYFFPTRYTMNDAGLEVRRLGVRWALPWSRYESYCLDSRGILLSPFPKPNRLENYRGNFILLANDSRHDIVEMVKRHLREMETDS